MTGSEWTDQVCVTLDTCINNFEFFLIAEQEGFREPVDGVLGLARNMPFFLAKNEGVSRGPSYMMALENAGLISENTFSMEIAPFGSDSTMDFGAPSANPLQWADQK